MDQFPTQPGPSSPFPPTTPPASPPVNPPGFLPPVQPLQPSIEPSAQPPTQTSGVPSWAIFAGIAVLTLIAHAGLLVLGSLGSEEPQASIETPTAVSEAAAVSENFALELASCEVRDDGQTYPYLTGEITNNTEATASYRLDISVRQDGRTVAERIHFKDDVQSGRTALIDVPILDASDIDGPFTCDVWVDEVG